MTSFITVRSVVAGMFGALIALLGGLPINVQTGIWLVFGILYLTIGLAFLIGLSRVFKRRINLAPSTWIQARNPLVLGLAFGLNIPACAAPILFGLLGLAATMGTILTDFVMMFIFGFFLSMPLVLFATVPSMATRLDNFGVALKQKRWIIGAVFVALGIWSIWFGLICRSRKLDRQMRRPNRFTSVAAAGITFQAGSAAVDSATIMSALVFQLTGSSIIVGAVTAILRFGWLFPQLIVGFLVQWSGSSMQYYVIGAFGRATCMALMALVLFIGADLVSGSTFGIRDDPMDRLRLY